ncbi:ABC transporter ATP-binding protein [Paeniglutamicibacter cryotolerans]|uniref:ABC-2 type transport system ATP-binding protein n=1 Tax=Paeniglutamicibacter cryotolerans TaxID=670079 RepID=A0A839QK12_9MICC|nr:ABC transporter ATP-binding protein [Paeniglutamicibacter cryotolerans]MBB2994885.1 ABC-2 type transport system ATP-binding protein [Paeniglutamicibacter cryotolerans]
MIEAQELAKNYGRKRAVDSVSFTVQPGRVTGFLGPNGAGKSTTMRMIVGLDRPSAGRVTVNGRPFARHAAPLREVGALLDAKSVHKSRSARSHLRALAATHSIPLKRVDEVIELTGLGAVARKRVGGFSLGMGQRLGIAAALLGDPQTLILDEPVNGLDPEGVLWVRNLARSQAAQGKTVFLSSHLMSEMSLTADHLIVIGRGRIIADAPIEAILNGQGTSGALVRTDSAVELMNALAADHVQITRVDEFTLQVAGVDSRTIAARALDARILVYGLTPTQQSLEQAYMDLTKDEVEYHSSLQAPAAQGAMPGKQI